MTEAAPTPLDYSSFDALEGRIAPARVSFLYRFTLVLVAVTMVLLPLIYLLIVGSAAWAVIYHGIYNWSPIMSMGGDRSGDRFIMFKLLIYLGPLLMGGLLVFFLFKPLFARVPKAAQPLALNPSTDPLIFAFIERICGAVGAPSPRRIDLDCRLNAAAGFRRGFRSFLSHDMVLVLGMPLVANLNIQELAGVVAHEFGHFTQGAGMRVSYIIRAVNVWFARVCYERDAWDVALEAWSYEADDAFSAVIVWTVHLGVWISRLILKLLMLVGVLIGGFMLRQMEYDADSYQIRIAGSDVFEITHRKLATLQVAMEQSGEQLAESWKKYRTLPDNLPEHLRRHRENLSSETVQHVDDTMGLERAGWFDSHPSPADRIREARKAGDPGIFRDERPASMLFSSFEHPCRFVTLLHYTDNLGLPITQPMLTPVHTEQRSTAMASELPAATEGPEGYFFDVLPLILPLRVPTVSASSNWDTDMAELNQLTSGLRQVSGELAARRRDYEQATSKLIYAQAGLCLLHHGMAVDPGQFGRSECSVEAAASAEKEAIATRKGLRASLHEVAQALTRRLELGLSLALAAEPNCSEGAAPESEIAITLNAVNEDAAIYERQLEFVQALKVLSVISSIAEIRGGSQGAARAFDRQLQVVCTLMDQSKPAQETTENAAAGGLRLRNKARTQLTMPELNDLAEATGKWMEDYRARLDKLVQAAHAVEGATV